MVHMCMYTSYMHAHAPTYTHTHTHTHESVMLYNECQQNVITLMHSAEVSKVHPTGTYPSEPGVGQPSG